MLFIPKLYYGEAESARTYSAKPIQMCYNVAMKKKRLIILGAIVFVIVASTATTLALKHEDQPKQQASIALADTSKETKQTSETTDDKETPTVEVPKPSTSVKAVAPEKQAEEPETSDDSQYDYLNPSLKNRISAADEKKTRQCFQLGVDISKERRNFTDIEKIAQVSRELTNPCGMNNDDYTPSGKFLYSYVDWCILRAKGDEVPPVVDKHIAVRMCEGF
jgi:hypothetical protein